MNINSSVFGRSKTRNKNFRKRGQNVVNIQRPLNNASKRKSVTHTSTSSSAFRWKEASSTNNNTSSVLRSATSSRTFSSSDTNSRIVLALSQGRGEATYEVGIAAVDVSRPSLVLCQISDAPSYINTLTKINIFNPDEILVPLTFVGNFSSNRLLDKIKEQFKDTTITAVARSTFNKVTGMQYIKQLCASEWNSILITLQHKYYCLAAAAALLNYAESVLYVCYTDHSLKVEYQESEGFTIIDVTTADNLELVASVANVSDKKYSSLFSILNHCQTRIGARTLRASILQPPCAIPDIESRLDCVTELKKNPNMLAGVQAALNKLANVDQLLTLATIFSEHQETCSDRQLNYILTLNSILEFINPLKELFEGCAQLFFKEFSQTLASVSFDVMRKLIRLLIHTDARPAKGEQGVFQRCFAIKPGVNGLLDIVRKSYSERLEDMRVYVKELGEHYNLPLTLGNNTKKGYHIILTLNQQTKKSFKKSELNDEFIQVERLFSTVTMKTVKLINYTARVEDIQIEVIKLSNIMIHQLFIELRAYIGLFYKLCEDVAKLDMLQSLAQASSNVSNTRPKFNDYMELEDARHPLLDYLSDTEPVANSILLSKYNNIQIITGPNSSGKSVFIRQVLLLQVMAQVGCFVPATKATFRPCDRILARVQFDDNMECNASSFVLEVKEMQYFRSVLTENSLIIVDELCRSTAIGEGTALAVALCEDLAKTNAYIFFATHYIFMTNVADVYPNVQNWQMEVVEEKQGDTIKLQFTYNLIPGVTTTKKYGLFAAATVWPKTIVEDAKIFFMKPQHSQTPPGTNKMEKAFRSKYNLETDLKILKMKGTLDLTALNTKLTEYFVNLKELGYDLDDDDNIQLTVQTQRISSDTVRESSRTPVSESQEILARNFNRSLDQMTLTDTPCLYPEVVYSQSDGIEDRCVNIEDFFESNPPNVNGILEQNGNDDQVSIQMSFPFNGKIAESPPLSNLFTSYLKEPSDEVISLSPQREELDGDVSAVLENVHEDDFEEFQSLTERTKSPNATITKMEQDAEVSAALQEVQSLSAYFTASDDEWDVLTEAAGKTQSSTPNQPGKTHVLLQSVHIFDKYNNLVDVQLHEPPRKKHLQNQLVESFPQRKDNEETKGEVDTLNEEESISYSPISAHENIPESPEEIFSQNNPQNKSVITFFPNTNSPDDQTDLSNRHFNQISPDVFEPSKTSSEHSILFPVKENSSKSNLEQLISDITPREKSVSLTSQNTFENNKEVFTTPSVRPPKRKRGTFKTPVKHLSTFIPPKPLTKQEILTSYRKTMEKYLQTSNDEESAAKNMERIMNMPSVEQLRHQKYIAKIQKTDEGVVVIPAAVSEKRPRKHVPLKRKLSADFDKTFLSDKNSTKFFDFLNSKKNDTPLFQFDNPREDFDIFQQQETKQDDLEHSFLNIEFSPSVTPDGYYKVNKGVIDDMLDKYL